MRALVYCNFLKEVRLGGLGLRAQRHQHKASLLECMRHHSNLWIGGDHSSGVYTGLVQLDSIHKLLSKPGLICCRGVVTTKCGPHLSLCFGWWPQLVVSTYSYVYALHWYLPMHCEACCHVLSWINNGNWRPHIVASTNVFSSRDRVQWTIIFLMVQTWTCMV